jgi:hypothetical protein
MKTKLKLGFLCSFIIAGFGFGWQASAADSNPYGEGTTAVRLSAEEKTELLQYADNSKARLEKAMERAKGKGFAEANSIYLSAIKSVVLYSYVQKPRSELLMRYTLNQALSLTFGVPTADGKSLQSPGVLRRVSNDDLLTIILEDSIQLALKFYQDDRTAIQNGTLVNLPFMKQALVELALVRRWLPSVNEPSLKYNLSIAGLQNFLNTAANEDQTRRALFAEELTEVSNLLDSYPAQAPTDVESLMRNVRVLRGKIKKLEESVSNKLLGPGAFVRNTEAETPKSSSARSSNNPISSANFDACYSIYFRDLNATQAANSCLEPERVKFNFSDSNFLACYQIYYRDLRSHEAANKCMEPARVSFDFRNPDFEKCYAIYYRDMYSHNAADKCISQSLGH